MTRHIRSVVLLVVLLASEAGAGCSSSQPASRVTDVPLPATKPGTRESIDRYEKTARASSDPVACWIEALREEDPEIVQAALIRVGGSGDGRLIGPLEDLIRRWKGRRGHDQIPVAEYATIELDSINADQEWKNLRLEEGPADSRLEKLLKLSKSNPQSPMLREKIFSEFLQSSDGRIIPFLIQFPREEATDKILSFGKAAVPALLGAAFHSERSLVRQAALGCLMTLKPEEAIAPMIQGLRDIKTGDILGKNKDPLKCEVLNSLKIGLASYGPQVLDRLTPELAAADPLVRDHFLNIIAMIGGNDDLCLT